MSQETKLKNIAIIAHVDHGKTTLVDALLKGSGLFREGEVTGTQIMDSDDIERERGITILAKNTAIRYKDARINIVDTPGHADFGGEVERILKMVDGVLLLVDAYDGPMPQTRFVLSKAMEKNLKTIVVINKIDRPNSRAREVVDMVYELFIDLGANDEQIEFPIIFASAKNHAAFKELPDDTSIEAIKDKGVEIILDTIIDEIPEARGDATAPVQVLVSNIDYDNYLGRLAIGKIERGTLHKAENIAVLKADQSGIKQAKANNLYVYDGLGRKEVQSASSGEIVCISGVENVNIGDTLADPLHPEQLDFVSIEEPTIAMMFQVNDSPLAGTEGKYLTSRHIKERLEREMLRNVAMRLEFTDSPDRFLVKGRGELHISILIENMRREGYEFQVSRPYVITKEIDGVMMEPQEQLHVTVGEDYSGVVIEKLGQRKAELVSMEPPFKGNVRMVFIIPSSQLIGYRTQFMNDTRGNGMISSILDGYVPSTGESVGRGHGVLVAHGPGEAITYGLHNAQDRGSLFIRPGTTVYEGMIIGTTMQMEDVTINVCKKKQLTNIRAAGSDETLKLTPPIQMSLEQCLEFIDEGEMIEVTPQNIRMRKRILDSKMRNRQSAKSD